MGALTVYATATARRYHSRWSCRAVVSAQMLSDYDCDDYCRHDHPSIHPALDCTVAEAAGRGLTPCRVCTPPLGPAADFGHVPFFYDGVDICTRCWTRSDPWSARSRDPVPWPCASAVVLGLTPTT